MSEKMVFRLGFRRTDTGAIVSWCSPHNDAIATELRRLVPSVRLKSGSAFYISASVHDETHVRGARLHPRRLFDQICDIAERGAEDLEKARVKKQAEDEMPPVAFSLGIHSPALWSRTVFPRVLIE